MKLVLIGKTLTLKVDVELDLKHFSLVECETEAYNLAISMGFTNGNYFECDEEEVK